MRALVYMLYQDDPFKCTAAKLVKFGLAERVASVPRGSILLDPFSEIPISKADSALAGSVCAIDCSWDKADEVLGSRRYKNAAKRGIGRRLPAMLAANPVNYAMLAKLSSAEALAGALYVIGDMATAKGILDKFKWGHTFFELNSNLLEDYSKADTIEQIIQLEKEYFALHSD
jgi:pre-rRNA-processing protein TSR3